MPFERIRRESDKNGNSQEKNKGVGDFTKRSLKQKEAADAQQPREIDASPQSPRQWDIEYQSHPSKIFGLNQREDRRGNPANITGAYDPTQERWVSSDRPSNITARQTAPKETWQDKATYRPGGDVREDVDQTGNDQEIVDY